MSIDPERALAKLVSLPRHGWVDAASPVVSLPALAAELGLSALWIKRDDALGQGHGLPGGTKIRKLDVLLATLPWRDAPGWASVGAIGSGQLVALSAAARLLGRRLRSHLFWEPPSEALLEQLAYVASGPGDLRYTHTRLGFGLCHPRMLLAERIGERAVVPPGASGLPGEAGIVLGALELAAQIATGDCPAPAHVFAPWGSGGTLAGLVVGLGLARVRCTVHGVAAVERLYAPEARLRGQIRALLQYLDVPGLPLPALRLDHDQVGSAYGVATPASTAACVRLRRESIGLEPIYSGKAMAGLAAAASRGALRGPVLFWLTPRAPAPLPCAPDWQERLPGRLRRRLAATEPADHPAGGGGGPIGGRNRPDGLRAIARPPGSSSAGTLTRRRVLLAGVGLVAAGTLWRWSGYDPAPAGLTHLGDWASAVLRAALPAVVPGAPPDGTEPADDVLRRIDAFVGTQPRAIRWQVLGALALVEQGPLPLARHLPRFSDLEVDERRTFLDRLAELGGMPAEAGRAVRDLCVLGFYQRPESWPALGYGGPWVGSVDRPDPYAPLRTDAPPPGFEGES